MYMYRYIHNYDNRTGKETNKSTAFVTSIKITCASCATN